MASLTEVVFNSVIFRLTLAPQPTTILTQSQKHWRAWVKALQTRDASVRAEALDQLSRFLNYWTTDLCLPTPIRGFLNGQDTPQPESWDEVFNVDADLLIRSKRAVQARLNSNEAWVCSPLRYVELTGSLGRMD
jgi:hypothetical protein